MTSRQDIRPAAYLDTALTIIERHALSRSSVDWVRIRAEARRRCASAGRPSDTYAAIAWVLAALGDGHSFFSPPDSGSEAIASGEYVAELSTPSASVRPDGVGHLVVPAFRGPTAEVVAYADLLHALIGSMAGRGVTGWIVDLADNTGGNMLPMVSGLGPLLGDGVCGYFVAPREASVPWVIRDGGELWIGPERTVDTAVHVARPGIERTPVAVVLGADTASSGEAVAVAFVGRPRTRSFGHPTRGLTTSNDVFDLADGASIVLTVARFASRDGRPVEGPLVPDQDVPGSRVDAVAAAAQWLRGEPASPGPPTNGLSGTAAPSGGVAVGTLGGAVGHGPGSVPEGRYE